MPLPPDFQFSQGNLQDYTDCPRRFQLRYLLELAWPAVEAEPADEFETRIRDGEAFHRLVQQHVLGVLPAGVAPEPGSDLAAWWDNYLASPPPDLPPVRHPEITLSAPLGEHRLIAKFDLIAIEPGERAVIVDWKTSAKRPRPGWLIQRLQTRVYRYLLVRAGAALNGGQPLRPEQIEMIYWFANFPDEPERLRYDATQFEADGRYLMEMAAGSRSARTRFSRSPTISGAVCSARTARCAAAASRRGISTRRTLTRLRTRSRRPTGPRASTSSRSGRSRFERHHRQRRADVT